MNETTTTVATTKKSEKPQVVDYMKKCIEYLKATGSKLPENQQKMFLEKAVEFQLNPFKREIYAVGYGENFSVITGFEVYIKRAIRTGKLDGWNVTVSGKVSDNSLNATITIYRKDWTHPFTHTVYYWECVGKKKDGTPTSMWQKQPVYMTKKVAMSQGFRLCFSDELEGMPYTAEEMGDIIETTAELIETKPVQQPTKPVEQPKQVDPELQAAQKRYVELKNSNVFSAEEMAHFKESWSKGWKECITEMEEAYNLKTAPVEEAQVVEPEPQDNGEAPF